LSRSVFINATGSFFPNAPVSNEQMEGVLGMIHGRPSRSRHMVLTNNQIKTRYYAMDPQTRRPTHSNADLAKAAAQDIFARNPDLSWKNVELLCCGTTAADLIVPGHGQMVHGLLPDFTGEVVTTAGVCCSSSMALKNAFLSIKADDKRAAVVTGSEAASKFMRGEFFESESPESIEELTKNPMASFSHDFLRWMLSDGAGAVYLSAQPRAGQTNLRINWIEGRSYANEETTCMFAGGYQEKDGQVTSWKDLRVQEDPKKLRFAMNFQQDIRILREMGTHYTVERPLTELKKKYGLNPGDYSWFLPHYSSHYFRDILFNAMNKIDFSIPYERWFTTLYERGNIGSASIFVFIDDLIRSKRLQVGEKILCYVPESARFSVYYFELEVV